MWAIRNKLVANVDYIPGQNHKFESENVASGSGK